MDLTNYWVSSLILGNNDQNIQTVQMPDILLVDLLALLSPPFSQKENKRSALRKDTVWNAHYTMPWGFITSNTGSTANHWQSKWQGNEVIASAATWLSCKLVLKSTCGFIRHWHYMISVGNIHTRNSDSCANHTILSHWEKTILNKTSLNGFHM